MTRAPGEERAVTLQHPPESRLELWQTGLLIRVNRSAGVAVDEGLARLWQWADGRTQADLESLPLFQTEPCLAEELMALRVAGLLLPPPAVAPRTETRLPDPLPLVSVVIVSRNGVQHLRECLPSLMTQTYPRIEVIVVENQSSDGSVEYIRANFPTVQIAQQSGKPNFAAGCNLGIKQASGELIFLLNNDTVLDSRCVEELVAAQAGHTDVGGVAAMLRFYDNCAFVNGLGTFVPSRGLGHDVAIGSLDVGQFDDVEQTPLLCFGAALLLRSAIARVGLLDERYEFYYEDADWSCRARACGLQLIAAPRAKVFHKFSASTAQLPSSFKTRLSRRNRLRYALKNFALDEALQRLASNARDDWLQYWVYLWRRQPALAAALVRAWLEFGLMVPGIMLERRRIRRGRSNQAVDWSQLAKPFPLPELQGTHPRLTQALIVNRYRPYLARPGGARGAQRVLIISPDTIDAHMGGVGVRYWELAQVLAEHAPVTLAVPDKTSLLSDKVSIRTYVQGRAETLKPLADGADVILLSGFTIYHHPFLRKATPHLVVDLYDPTVLENLERFSAQPRDEQRGLHQLGVATYNELLALGDFFICASEKQRDYWLGALTAANRINPDSYTSDPTLRRLIDVAPFGLPNDPPQHTRRVLKGVYPGIGENDKVIIWGGGLWDWLDPLSAVEAMPAVLRCVPQARLFFMGTRHPNPDVPPSRMTRRTIERATELGLKDRAVFFNDWVPYAERENYLLEADVGLSLHGDHLETRFAVRTRLMDYLWASLPMVVSGGDALSDLVAARGLGRVVPPHDMDAVAKSLVEILQAPIDRARFAPVAEMFRWPRVAESLVRYVAAPWRNGERETMALTAPTVPVTPLWKLPARAVSSLRARGLSGLARDVRSYLLWRATR